MKNKVFAAAMSGHNNNNNSTMDNTYLNIRKRSLKMTMKLLGAAFFILHSSFFISCSDWDDHYEGTSTGSSLTLWEHLQQHSELSDFCRVLENTKVFRMHRKTVVSYRQLLENADQSFTVVAPVNGSFNADSLISLTQTAQETVSLRNSS